MQTKQIINYIKYNLLMIEHKTTILNLINWRISKIKKYKSIYKQNSFTIPYTKYIKK